MTKKRKEKGKEEKEGKAVEKELTELRQRIAELEEERDELLGKLQRVSADYANFQKRVPKQIADSVALEKESMIKSLLPALDNFEHMLSKAQSSKDVAVLLKGVQIIYDQMQDILKSHQVEQIKALGEKFDPSCHEAMMQREEADKEEDIVLEEFQRGYKLNGRVIRPSKVVVNKAVPKNRQEEQSERQEVPAEHSEDGEAGPEE